MRRRLWGDAFGYAIRVCGVPGENFIKLFTVSSVSKHMENGEPAYLAGKSGVELAVQILAETTGTTNPPEPPERYARSCEYWIGWAVAYYQWYSGRKYSEIFKVLSFAELEKNVLSPCTKRTSANLPRLRMPASGSTLRKQT